MQALELLYPRSHIRRECASFARLGTSVCAPSQPPVITLERARHFDAEFHVHTGKADWLVHWNAESGNDSAADGAKIDVD